MFSKYRKQVKEITPKQLEIIAKEQEFVESVVTKARVAKLLNEFIDENILPDDCEQDMEMVAKILPGRCYKDCFEEEPDVVKEIDDFGKLCFKTSMKRAKEIFEERNGVC